MRISKSDYLWSMRDDVIIIEDLNAGGMSVTNDAENVVTEIFENSGEVIKKLPIIYLDSEGIWDEIVPIWDSTRCVDVKFLPLSETNQKEAIKKVKSINNINESSSINGRI